MNKNVERGKKKGDTSMMGKIKDKPELAVGPSKSYWTILLKKY